MPYCNKFDSFHTGYNFYHTKGLEEAFEDNLRYFAESCNSLQVRCQSVSEIYWALIDQVN